MEEKTLPISFDPYLEMIDLEIDGNLRKFVWGKHANYFFFHLVGFSEENVSATELSQKLSFEANLVEVLPFCPHMRLTGQPRDWQRLYVHLCHRSGDPQTAHYET